MNTSYVRDKLKISSSIDLFGAPTDIDSKEGYTVDPQLKVPEYNNHNDAGKLLYSKATLIMIKFNSENFLNFITKNLTTEKQNISLKFTITFDYSNDPYYTEIPNNTQTSGNTSA